jgi:hypothetical protein
MGPGSRFILTREDCMKRVTCSARPAFFGCEDIQLTPGMFYDLVSKDIVDGRIFYTVIGKDKVEIQRPADYFKFPPVKDVKKINLTCGVCAHKFTKPPKKEKRSGQR